MILKSSTFFSICELTEPENKSDSEVSLCGSSSLFQDNVLSISAISFFIVSTLVYDNSVLLATLHEVKQNKREIEKKLRDKTFFFKLPQNRINTKKAPFLGVL